MKSNFDRLDKHIRQYNLFNGNVLAANYSEIIYSGSFGFTNDIKQNSLINQNTIFELASVSKQFTAYSALKTIKNANESIDNDIRKYLPNFPYEAVTIRSLLNHTSGLPDYFLLLDQHWDKCKIATNSDVLNLIIKYKHEIHFTPNQKWEYSNTGYVLLALLVEIITGTSFSQCIGEQIFKPLNMKDSFVFKRRWKPREIRNYAFGTVYNESKEIFELPDNNPEYNVVYYLDGIQGDGTVNSTVLDILKWNNEVLNPSNLDRELIELMTTNTKTLTNENIDYGMGWIINNDIEIGKIIFHGGSWPGYSTYNSIYLDKGYSIIFLCNQPKNLEMEQQIIIAMENILLDKPFELPNETTTNR
jgi:CubicO group peptidase (beta-lactamase class C family)